MDKILKKFNKCVSDLWDHAAKQYIERDNKRDTAAVLNAQADEHHAEYERAKSVANKIAALLSP